MFVALFGKVKENPRKEFHIKNTSYYTKPKHETTMQNKLQL